VYESSSQRAASALVTGGREDGGTDSNYAAELQGITTVLRGGMNVLSKQY
jgi:hypothetical protein